MDTEKTQDVRELNEQELEQAAGAGGQKSFKCSCGCTEYDTVVVQCRFPRASYRVKQCKQCKKQYTPFDVI